MSTTTQPTVEHVRFPLVPRKAAVIEIVDLSPHMRLFVLQGEDLKSFDSQDADDHMKLVFSAAGSE